jgi:hypothetical protein
VKYGANTTICHSVYTLSDALKSDECCFVKPSVKVTTISSRLVIHAAPRELLAKRCKSVRKRAIASDFELCSRYHYRSAICIELH